MSPPLFLLAASAAASFALGPEASVHAFNLQLKTGRPVGVPSLVSSSTDLLKGPSSAPGAPLATAGASSLPVNELRLHAAPSPPGEEAAPSSGVDSSVLAMAAFLRCHKPLLNDRGPELPDGNLCMLLRGCDAHQRMISPLELKTNAQALPGAAAAGVMAAKGTAAAEALCEQLGESLKLGKGPHGVCPVELLKLEVGKVHRLLQFATAAGLKKNFLSSDALLVMLELYEEVGLNSDHIVQVVKGLRDFYQKEMEEKGFRTFFFCPHTTRFLPSSAKQKNWSSMQKRCRFRRFRTSPLRTPEPSLLWLWT